MNTACARAAVGNMIDPTDMPISDAPVDNARRLARPPPPGAAEFAPAITTRVLTDVALGCALLLPLAAHALVPRLAISPVFAVQQKNKIRTVVKLSKSGVLPDGTIDLAVNANPNPN